MNKNDRLFLASLSAALILIGFIMADNVTPKPASSDVSQEANNTRQKMMDLKLPLHEAKHWRNSFE